MTHLAEGNSQYSTIIVDAPIKVPNFGNQEWVIAFAQQAMIYLERREWLNSLES